MSGTYTTSSSLSSGQASGLTVSSTEELTVFGGASIVDTQDYGEVVLSGGTATGTYVHTGGVDMVDAGGTDSGASVYGGTMVVGSGGTETRAAVSGTVAPGENFLFNSSIDGELVVLSGGTASDTTVMNDGVVILNSGGDISGVTVDSGGLLELNSGATSAGATFDGGGLGLSGSSFNVTSQVLVASGIAELYVQSGATATATILGSATTVAAGRSGLLVDTTVGSGATLETFVGGNAENIVVSNGGQEFVSGLSVNTVVSTGGTIVTESLGFTMSETIDRGGQSIVDSAGYVQSAFLDGGTMIVDGGGEVFDVVVGSGGILEPLPEAEVENTIVSSGGELVDPGPQAAGGFRMDFASDVEARDLVLTRGADVDFQNITYSAGETATISPDDELEVEIEYAGETDVLTEINLTGDYSGLTATVSDDGYGGALVTIIDTPCFALGTVIDTPDGTVRVEELRVGDMVTTLGGPARVRWIGHRRATDVAVIRIRPHALGENAPRRDLCVSDDHALFLDDVLVPAGLLVNGTSIIAERRESVVLFHVELDAHGILLAEGAPAESYIDTGNRRQFGNCPIGYDPVSATQDHCAELVVAGARLERIRARLARVTA